MVDDGVVRNRQSAIKTAIFVAVPLYSGNNAPAVFPQHRNLEK
jgi:hypothetical protein